MSKPKLLVLGATGFIGRNIVKHFYSTGQYEIHATWHHRPYIDNLTLPDHFKNIKWHQVDLRRPEHVARIMPEMDIVIQAAATTSGAKDIIERPHIHVPDNAIMNSLIFLHAFEQRVRHVIFFSCTTMYESSDFPALESSPDRPPSKYFGVAHTKLYLEKMCEFYSRMGETKFTAIRHSNIYGPHDKFDLERSHVFGATVRKVMDAQDSVTVWGDGSEVRDLLYIDDLMHFVECAIEKQSGNFGLYNVGAGSAVSVSELVRKIITVSGKSLAIHYDAAKPTIPISVFLDCTKAKEDLGWESRISLEEGIPKVLAWYKNNL